MGVWLTDKLVRDFKAPERGSIIVRDAPDPKGKEGWTSGFALRATAGGSRSFVLSYRVRGTGVERRLTIGSWPTWSVVAARAEARELKQRIAKGADPLAELQTQRGAPTVAELCDRFLVDHVSHKRPNTRRAYTGIIENHIRAVLGRKLVAAVDHTDIERLHRRISADAPHLANRTIAVASRMFTLAVKLKLRPDNPCKGIERNVEGKRRRYLVGDELVRLTRALDRHWDQRAANVFRLLLLTGARKTEVLSATWDQFDFDRNVWTKPAATTKQKTDHEVPISAAALQLLKQMRKAAPEDATYLFPGRDGGHLTEVKKGWASIIGRAGISGLHIHDLRHSYASTLVSAGYSLPLVGALLGHTQASTTNRYAHLLDSPLREATNKVGSIMVGLVAKPPTKGKRKQLRIVR